MRDQPDSSPATVIPACSRCGEPTTECKRCLRPFATLDAVVCADDGERRRRHEHADCIRPRGAPNTSAGCMDPESSLGRL